MHVAPPSLPIVVVSWTSRLLRKSALALLTEAQPMSMEENKAIVRRFLEALDQQDFDALREHPGLYATVVRQPIIRVAFPDLQTTIDVTPPNMTRRILLP